MKWLDRPGAGPKLEFEAMIQVAFADAGSKEQLLGTLRAIRDHTEEQQQVARARMAEYTASGGPFPSRLAVIALPTKFFSEFADQLERWAPWAEAEVEGWEGTGPGEAAVPPSAWEPGLGTRTGRGPAG